MRPPAVAIAVAAQLTLASYLLLGVIRYTVPGQYVQIRQPGAEKAGFFAVASAPGAAGPFEFLIKEQPPSDWSPGTGWLTDASAGLELEMSQVMG